MNFSERWKNLSRNEYNHFERIAYPRSQRRDVHAMLLLDEIFPSHETLLLGRDSLDDEVYFSIKKDDLSTLTDDEIVELARCGVQYDNLVKRLWMLV